MKTLRSLSIAALVALAGITSRGGDAYLLYDLTTKQVSAPLVFWKSNLLAGAEITWTYTGNLPSPVLADSITRDTELSAAIASLSSVYQPLDADLTDLADGSLSGSKVGSGITGDNITTGTVADARIAPTIARLASPALTGTPTVNGTNFMALIASGGGGGGGGNASTNANQTWPAGYTQTMLGNVILGGTTTISNATFDSISAQSLTVSNALGQASGGTGGTNVATAQDALQITPGTYTQAYSASLAQIAGLALQSGDLLYHDGSQLQRLAKATNNQVLTLISGLPVWRDAPGNTNSTTNATTLAQIADVSISTNALRRNDIFGWNGSNKWVRIPPPAAFSNSDRYEGWHVGCTTTSSQSPYASTLINSGAGNANAGVIFGRSGYIRATTASSSAALYTGSSWMTGVTHLYGTNELFFHAEVRGAQTNGAAGRIGFFDSNSTNVFSNALGFTVTNNVWKFIAGLNGNFTLSGTSFVPDTNAWHQVEVYMTNAVAAVQVFTNGVLAFSDSISSTNVPVGATFGCGVNFFGTGASSTNGQDMVIINDVGHCYSKF